ncbi:hypothetical protein QVD17_11845 [Tagetes erecta]|uniref:SNRNP25 ubiquitin-like domain-containing protein n=1 Tax=Tagetes erecta TaxID=13708 RepID=A0AAD8P2J6_TARER|nr:hypothetical protein QVD17_11845 [Tagetes erecta]
MEVMFPSFIKGKKRKEMERKQEEKGRKMFPSKLEGNGRKEKEKGKRKEKIYMPHSSNQVHRPSPFTIATSFPPLLSDNRSYWKRVSFGRFSSQPIRLSILKLDGSTFDIIVMKNATVAKLKQAVEAAFSHLPRQGDCKISWSYVWGHFCLCFEHMKLLRDRDSITRYGIKNGDQLQFVRHTPMYTIAGETSVERTHISDESQGSSSISVMCGDMRSKQNFVKNEVTEGYRDFGDSKKYQSNGASTTRGLSSHRKQEGSTKRNDRVVRLGRPMPREDKDASRRLDTYPPNTFSDYVGGFGYPTDSSVSKINWQPHITLCGIHSYNEISPKSLIIFNLYTLHSHHNQISQPSVHFSSPSSLLPPSPMANMIMASSKTLITSPPAPKSTHQLPPQPSIIIPTTTKPQFPLSTTLKTLATAAVAVAATPLPSLAEEFEKAQLFDFDLTLPIIAAEFLFLMFTLDKLYYSPLGNFMDKRDAEIKEKLSSVKDTSTEVKQLEEQAAAVMRAARAEISAALNKMKKETAAEVDAKLAEGRKKVEAELQEALLNLEKQKEETIKSLDSQIAALSQEIVNKVLPVN